MLESLDYLHTMRLERQPESYYEEYLSVPSPHLYKGQRLSFTDDVMRALRPLRSFSIKHTTSVASSDFITSAMLQALSAHQRSLKTLWISSDYLIENSVLQQILDVVASFDLATVCIIVSSLPQNCRNIKLEDYITENIKRCTIWLGFHENGHNKILKHEFRR